MTPKQLVELIAKVVKKEIRAAMIANRKTLKEDIRSAVRAEITSILEDASGAKQVQPEPEPTSLSQLLSEEGVTENVEPIFQGKGKIFDVLNQTAVESKGKGQLIPSEVQGLNEQKEFVFNTTNTPASVPAGIAPINKAALAEKMGYGKMPIAGGATPGQTPITVEAEGAPDKVQVPTTNADGKPINLNKVNPDVIQSMMRNYSGFLKKMDNKVKQTRV